MKKFPWRTWVESYGPWLFPLLVALFLTQGLPLWAEDYDFWLTQAHGGILPLLQRLVSPITQFAGAWGVGDRPMVVAAYGLLGAIGSTGAVYFFAKSVAFAIASLWLNRTWRQTFKISPWIRGWLIALWLCAPVVAASLLHLSDTTLLTQVGVGFFLWQSVRRLQRDPKAGAADFPRFAVVFFLAVYWGAKIGPDVRVLPLILLVWCGLFRPKQLSAAYIALFATSELATLPWSLELFRKLPPFFPGGVANAQWSPWSFGRMLDFLWHDALTGASAPISILGGVGATLVILVAGLWGLRMAQGMSVSERLLKSARDPYLGATLIWWCFNLLASGALTRQNPFFDLKNGALLWVPTLLLWGPVLEVTWRELQQFAGRKWVAPLWSIVFVLHLGLLARFSLWHRRDLGHTMVATDKIFREMESKPADSQFVLAPGMLRYATPIWAQNPAVRMRASISQWNEIARYPVGKTWVASWGATLDSSFVEEFAATGCAQSSVPVIFDLLFPCGPADGAQLLRYVGPIPALGQAFALERQGDLSGARQKLENYLAQEPYNLGVLFNSSMYSYRMGDFTKMEQAYEVLGAFLPQNASVLYNWGIAQQGLKKWKEAIARFEQADRLSPGNYGILFNLAECWARLGNYKRARKIGEELLKSFPHSVPLQQAIARWSAA